MKGILLIIMERDFTYYYGFVQWFLGRFGVSAILTKQHFLKCMKNILCVSQQHEIKCDSMQFYTVH